MLLYGIIQHFRLQRISRKLQANERCTRKDFETLFYFLRRAAEYDKTMDHLFLAMYLAGDAVKDTSEQLAKKSTIELIFEALHRNG